MLAALRPRVDRDTCGGEERSHRALPLLGADFESEVSDVTLLFGAAGREEAHLTHLVRDVRGVDRLIDSQGVDRRLVIVSGAATTWLRVLP